jgi:AraC-like DNA-binding protein
MNSITILGIVQALFLSLLILNKKNKGVPDKNLIFLLVFTALHQVFFIINFNENINVNENLLIIGSGFPLLSGPFLYWYVSSLINDKNKTSRYILHSIPFFLYIISFLYYFNTGDFFIKVYDGYMHLERTLPKLMKSYPMIFALSGGGYPTFCVYILIKHKRNIKQQFSYEEHINLIWLRNVILITIFTFLISFFAIFFMTDKNYDFKPIHAFYITSAITTIYIFLMGYFGLKQTKIFNNPILDEIKNETARYKSGLDDEKSKECLSIVDNYMHQEKPFLNGKMTIRQLSDVLNLSTNHISQAINENLSLNFFDYVNSFRIEEFKKRINDPQYKHLTILGIAFDCGFNSKSSFNELFKKSAGLTPSQYKRQLNEQK